MKASHFELDKAKTRIRKFFEDAAAHTGGADKNAGTDDDDSTEFGCVREGRLLFTLPVARAIWDAAFSDLVGWAPPSRAHCTCDVLQHLARMAMISAGEENDVYELLECRRWKMPPMSLTRYTVRYAPMMQGRLGRWAANRS